MTSYDIYWNDLTPEAQQRLKPLWHDNIDNAPLAVVDIEDDEVEISNAKA